MQGLLVWPLLFCLCPREFSYVLVLHFLVFRVIYFKFMVFFFNKDTLHSVPLIELFTTFWFKIHFHISQLLCTPIKLQKWQSGDMQYWITSLISWFITVCCGNSYFKIKLPYFISSCDKFKYKYNWKPGTISRMFLNCA